MPWCLAAVQGGAEGMPGADYSKEKEGPSHWNSYKELVLGSAPPGCLPCCPGESLLGQGFTRTLLLGHLGKAAKQVLVQFPGSHSDPRVQIGVKCELVHIPNSH